jgi:hypothetical protein
MRCRRLVRQKEERDLPFLRRRALKFAVRILTSVIIQGRKAPDTWTYFVCESCGAHYKRYDGDFVVPSDQEWAEFCSKINGANHGQR